MWEFVPLPGEVTSFFTSAAEEIWSRLRDVSCMPSTSPLTDGAEDGRENREPPLFPPSQLLFPPDEALEHLLSSTELHTATKKRFLQPHAMSPRMRQVRGYVGYPLKRLMYDTG